MGEAMGFHQRKLLESHTEVGRDKIDLARFCLKHMADNTQKHPKRNS